MGEERNKNEQGIQDHAKNEQTNRALYQGFGGHRKMLDALKLIKNEQKVSLNIRYVSVAGEGTFSNNYLLSPKSHHRIEEKSANEILQKFGIEKRTQKFRTNEGTEFIIPLDVEGIKEYLYQLHENE